MLRVSTNDLWPGDSKKKCTLTYAAPSMDEFLAGDSRIFCICESEVRFGFNSIFSGKTSKFVKYVALPMKKLCTLLRKDWVKPKTNIRLINTKNTRISCQKFIQ